MGSDLHIGIPKAHAGLNLLNGRIRGIDFRGHSRFQHHAIYLQLTNRQAHHLQRAVGQAHAAQERLFGLLKIAVVAAGQRTDHLLDLLRIAGDSGCLAADQLEHVGITLLRHDAGTRAELLRQGKVAELRHRKENEILGRFTKTQHQLFGRIEEDGLELAAGVVGIQHVVLQASETEQVGGHLPVEGQRHTVTGRRTEG